jgi:D-alanyl-D-alanine carboxypeptidase
VAPGSADGSYRWDEMSSASAKRIAGAVAATLVLLALVAPGAAAIAAPDRAGAQGAFSLKERKQLAAIVRQQMTELRQPGVDVGVWVPGRGAWVRSFGVADRETGRKLRVSDHFRIASITKTFTATAILQLVDQGKLSLDDTLEKFIPGIANGAQITIRNLLGMTSGIYDYTMDEQFGKDFDANPRMPFDLDDVIAIVKRHEPEFAPGEKVVYCDTNYYFLGAILEQVTGLSLPDVIQTQILNPLKLDETSYPTTTAMPSPFAHGYYAGPEGTGRFRDVTRLNPAVGGAAGAMISTLGDLRVWARALATGTLLSPELQAQRLQFGAIPNPGGIEIGYGLGIFKLGDFIGHNGAIYGYSSAMFYLPAEDAIIVVEGNQSSNFLTATTTILFELAEYLFPQDLPAS